MKFVEYLKEVNANETEFDACIGDVDMPATYCGCDDMVITDYCMEKYGDLLNSECEVRKDPTGTYTDVVIVAYDDPDVGKEFMMAAAGYCSETEYDRLFSKEDEKEDSKLSYEEFIEEMDSNTLRRAVLMESMEDLKSRNKNMLDRIVGMLVNTDKNEALLRRVPHRSFLDLSVIYKLLVTVDGQESLMTITNYMSEVTGIDEQALYETAMENLTDRYAPVVVDFSDVLKRLCAVGYPRAEDAEASLEYWRLVDGNSMVAIYGHGNLYGAAALLRADVLQNVAEKLDSDLYILPSSVYELMVMPAKCNDVEVLQRVVCGSNEKFVDDVLSDNVYLYSRETREVTIATSNGNIGQEECI